MKEELRPIPGYHGRYLASNLGRIFTTSARGLRRLPAVHNTMHYPMKLQKHRNGYRWLKLRQRGHRRARFVHRLVMAAFVGPSRLEVHHLNRDKADNRLANLVYITRQEHRRCSNYTQHPAFNRWQKTCGRSRAKLNEEEVQEMRQLYRQGCSFRTLANRFGVDRATARRAVTGCAWKHLAHATPSRHRCYEPIQD